MKDVWEERNPKKTSSKKIIIAKFLSIIILFIFKEKYIKILSIIFYEYDYRHEQLQED